MINNDQTKFQKIVGENIRLTLNTIDFTNTTNLWPYASRGLCKSFRYTRMNMYIYFIQTKHEGGGGGWRQ